MKLATLKNKEQFFVWLSGPGRHEQCKLPGYEHLRGWYGCHWKEFFYNKQKMFSDSSVINLFDKDNGDRQTEEFRMMLDHLEELGESFDVLYEEGIAAIIGYNGRKWLMPVEWLCMRELKDYSAYTASELMLAQNDEATASMLPSDLHDASVNTLTERKVNLESDEAKLKDAKNSINEETHEALAELHEQIAALKTEMERKKEALLAELAKKQAELEEQKKVLERQILVLETQIYGIRCYLGEVVKFHTFKTGVPAPVDTPIILHQKLRYLDEEMGRYLSLYDFGEFGDDEDTFIKVLANRTDIRDLFLPDDKCLSIAKLSKTVFRSTQSNKCANIFEKYEFLHGKQLAVLLRNGENLSIAWLDENRITLSEEDLFMLNPTAGKVSKAIDAEDVKNLRQTSENDRISRYFLFEIIQGVLDNSTLLQIPEKVKLMSPSKYIVFSSADGRLEDSTYGTFSDITAKADGIELKVGDAILTGMHIRREDHYWDSAHKSARYETYNNERGIGSRNRTHDADVSHGVHRINKIMYSYIVEYVYDNVEGTIASKASSYSYTRGFKQNVCVTVKYVGDYVIPTENVIGETVERKHIDFDCASSGLWKTMIDNNDFSQIVSSYSSSDAWYYKSWRSDDSCFIDRSRLKTEPQYDFMNSQAVVATESEKKSQLYQKRLREIRIVEKRPHYFVSVDAESYNYTTYKVNFEVFPDEFIPLTFLCPTWIEYVITTKHIEGLAFSNSDFSYAEALKYLNQILAHLRDVKVHDAALLTEAGAGEWMKNTSKWDVILAEWRIKNRVHTLTLRSAKRFAKEAATDGKL